MNLFFNIPVMNERETLLELTQGILDNTTDHAVTIFYIDDGSTDGSDQTLNEINAEFPQVKVHHFAQNQGKSEALKYGFGHAHGDIVFTMDSDLQDDPTEIPRFIETISKGNDLVTGWKVIRHDPWHKTLPSKVYNTFVCTLFGIKLHDINCGFKAMTLPVAQSLVLKHDYHRLIPVLTKLNGYTIAEIEVRHHARRYGQSKYGLSRIWHGLRDTFRVWRDKDK